MLIRFKQIIEINQKQAKSTFKEIKTYMFQYNRRFSLPNEEGKVRLSENKEKEWINGTDLGDHFTKYFQCSHLYEQNKYQNPRFESKEMVIHTTIDIIKISTDIV